MLEEYRRARVNDLTVTIQKTFRGFLARQKWLRMRDSQITISGFWKRWKDKSNVVELAQRRREEWAAVVVQRCWRCWRVRKITFWRLNST